MYKMIFLLAVLSLIIFICELHMLFIFVIIKSEYLNNANNPILIIIDDIKKLFICLLYLFY